MHSSNFVAHFDFSVLSFLTVFCAFLRAVVSLERKYRGGSYAACRGLSKDGSFQLCEAVRLRPSGEGLN